MSSIRLPPANYRAGVELAEPPQSETPDAEVLETLRSGEKMSGFARLLIVMSLIGTVIAILVAAGRYTQPVPPQYTTQSCTQGDLVVAVTATGTLDPTNCVEIGCEISGTIRTVEVDYNDAVKTGDLLLTFDTIELEAQIAKSRATLAVRQAELQLAEATLVETRRKLQRLEKLAEKRAASGQDVDIAQANFARAEAQLASMSAQVSVAQATLDGDLSKLQKSKVYSPIDGIVLVRNVEPGQTIAATFQTPILLTICEDLRTMKLKIDVDEADVGNVREGQEAKFTVDAFPDEQFPARITSVHFASRRVQDVVTYEAVLEVANQELKLRPGMTAVADIVTSKVENTRLVPNAALRFTPDDEALQPLPEDEFTSRVWAIDEGEIVSIPVKTGRSDGSFTEITAGTVKAGVPLVVDMIP